VQKKPINKIPTKKKKKKTTKKKKQKKKKKNKKKKKKKTEEAKPRARPPKVELKVGQACHLPLSEQLFDDEKKALEEFKKQCENTKYYSDEFIVACLFTKKFDTKRTAELIENNLKWRRENGFMNIPCLKDLEPVLEKLNMTYAIPGARDKLGSGITYTLMATDMEIGKEPYTIPTFKKWFAWFYFVGIFHDGIDSLRGGITFIEDLSGFGWKHFDIDFQKQMSSIWTDVFPVRLRRVLVLNPPVIFSAIMKICKTFMKGKLLDRFEVVDKVKDLRQWIAEDQLSTAFGGSVQYDYANWIKELKAWAAVHEERLIAPGRQ